MSLYDRYSGYQVRGLPPLDAFPRLKRCPHCGRFLPADGWSYGEDTTRCWLEKSCEHCGGLCVRQLQEEKWP